MRGGVFFCAGAVRPRRGTPASRPKTPAVAARRPCGQARRRPRPAPSTRPAAGRQRARPGCPAPAPRASAPAGSRARCGRAPCRTGPARAQVVHQVDAPPAHHLAHARRQREALVAPSRNAAPGGGPTGRAAPRTGCRRRPAAFSSAPLAEVRGEELQPARPAVARLRRAPWPGNRPPGPAPQAALHIRTRPAARGAAPASGSTSPTKRLEGSAVAEEGGLGGRHGLDRRPDQPLLVARRARRRRSRAIEAKPSRRATGPSRLSIR